MPDSPLPFVAGSVPSVRPPEPVRVPKPQAVPSASDAPAPSPWETAKPALTTDLKTLADAANEAAKREATQWFFLVTLMVYLAVAVGGTTHRVLFLEQPVQLPIFNVQVPLVGFYWLAPALLLAMHFYLLVQIQVMAGKVEAVLEAAEADANGDRAAFRRALHRLDEFPVAQLMAAARLRERAWALQGMAWGTLAVAPVGLLLFVQLRFLPYHDEAATWWHRGLVLADLALLWWLWPIPPTRPGRHGWPWWAAVGTLTASVIAFSFVLAVIPGEADLILERTGEGQSRKPADWAVRRWLFDGAPDVRQRPTSLFSRSLVLPDEDFVQEDEKARDEVLRTRVLRGRDLRFAVLDRADMRKADLTGARLEGASLDGAQMQGASLRQAKMQGASLVSVQMQGALLDWAQMQGASLDDARMQGASLVGARMQSASLFAARMQGARLDGARMQGASLFAARMQGASLDEAQMQGALLDRAQMQGALLDRAQMQGALLGRAQMQGASLDGAQMQGASLDGAQAWRSRAVRADTEDSLLARTGFGEEPPCTYGRDEDGECHRDNSWAQWVEVWLADLQEGWVKNGARRRLAVLLAPPPDLPEATATAAAWHAAPLPDPARIAQRLGDLACDASQAPHLARGVLRQIRSAPPFRRAFPLGRDLGAHRAALAARVAGNDCPGARGLTGVERARLRAIAAGRGD